MAGLIQLTLRRRGLPSLVDDEELLVELAVWNSALSKVPDAHLARAWERAAENWDWFDPRRPFTPDAVFEAYKDLLVEARREEEAERREAAFRNPGAVRCRQCGDEGYAPVFTWRYSRWYLARRPCFCPATPPEQRLEPLAESEFERDQLGRYVRRTDLAAFGPPDSMFKRLADGRSES